MTGTKIKKNKILIALSLIIVLVMGSAEFLYAEDGVSMPDLSSNSSTITILTKYIDEEVSIPIEGMELTVYKVADVTVKNGKVNYTATKDFKSVAIDFNNLTTSSSIDAADELSKLVEGGKITGKKEVSDSRGVIKYGSVENGMYLVVQTGATGTAEEYTRLRPYIITAPQSMTEVGENDWEYNVVSIPKMEVLNKVVSITKKVNGDDDVAIQDPASTFSYAIISELSYAPDDFAVVDNIPDALEIVDKNLIEIEVNGKKLDKDVKNSILKIKDNTLRVEPTKEQIEQWWPLEIKVLFYCKFREGVVLTEESANVINVAGYEVDGLYVEPKGEENQAEVRAEFANPTTKVETTTTETQTQTTTGEKGKGTRTGDEFAMYLRLLIILMTMSAIVIVILVRRKKARN